jgi:hypothetical protein
MELPLKEMKDAKETGLVAVQTLGYADPTAVVAQLRPVD